MAFRRFRSRRPVSKRIKSVFGRGAPTIFRGVRLKYEWHGQKVITQMNTAVERAFARAEDAARDYWNNVVWSPELHPYATGAEQRSADFHVTRGRGGRVRFTISVPLGEEGHAIFHEFGTSNYEGHFPVRQTIDFIGPRIRLFINEELRAMQGGG